MNTKTVFYEDMAERRGLDVETIKNHLAELVKVNIMSFRDGCYFFMLENGQVDRSRRPVRFAWKKEEPAAATPVVQVVPNGFDYLLGGGGHHRTKRRPQPWEQR
jgi:hypothetical protein